MLWNSQTVSGWGNVLRQDLDLARPERVHALSDLISTSDQILPVGSQRSYGDTALGTGGYGLKTERMDRMLSFDAETGVLEVEAGIKLGEIMRVMAPRGWKPAVVPGTGMTSVGGAIANDVHGKNHHIDGSFGQHVKSFTLITADGTERKISPEKNKELFQATLGGVGQTGLITSAVLQLSPCPSTKMAVTENRIPDLDAFIAAFEASKAPYQVGWIDALATGFDLGRGILEEAEFANSAPKRFPKPKQKSIPFTPPAIAVSNPFVKIFNALYMWRVPKEGRKVYRPLTEFFFPLDKISNWNKLYGKRGFYQFQAVLPTATTKEGMRDLLEIISEGGIASPLAVLKKMGPGRSGYMSFPMEGYTLAIDLPNKPETLSILRDLAKKTQEHQGRIYLAKDGAASAGDVEQMYPELGKFRKVVVKHDPSGKFRSEMSERLNLRGQS